MSRNAGVTVAGLPLSSQDAGPEIFGNMLEPEAKSSNVELLNGNAHHYL
jgi:hypothetical protein